MSAIMDPPSIAAHETLWSEIHDLVAGSSYPDGWPNHEQCPCCESAHIRYDFSKHGLHHWQCRSCRFIFANPHPPEHVLDELYNGSYMNAVRKHVELPKARAGRTDAAQSMQEAFYVELIDRVSGLLDRGTWLDVGGGAGHFLAQVGRRLPGVEPFLCEKNRLSAEFARSHYGIEVLESTPSLLGEQGRHFDVVSSLAVIEHLSHPRQAILELARLVSPGGILLLNIPQYTTLCRLLAKSASYAVTAPMHLSLFSRRNLTGLLRNIDLLERPTIWDTGPQAFQWLMLAGLTTHHDVVIPTDTRETLESIQTTPYSDRQLFWYPKLSRIDQWPVVRNLLERLDGRVYMNVIARRKR